MNGMITAALILSAVSGMFSQVRQLQMLQQNSYFPSRYFKWLYASFTPCLALEAVLFCVISFRGSMQGNIAIAAVSLLLLAVRIPSAVRVQKKSVKKLVFTARIKRLLTAGVIILALFSVFAICFNGLFSEICLTTAFMLSIVAPLLTLLCWIVTLPIEKAFTSWYINDAKRILREHSRLTVIGITGSFGKTTTKFILERILSEHFNTVCTPQSFNTPMGVVRTVRGSLKPQTQMFICEMGAKNIGDIKEICDIVHPQYGIITSVGEQHLDTFKSVDNVFRTKFELADAVSSNGGITFVNAESKAISQKITADRNDIIRFGFGTENRAENIRMGPSGSSFDLVLGSTVIPVTTKLLGAHSISDILAAAALAFRLGVTPDEIRCAVSALKPTEHRLELKSFNKGSLLIDDAYNSNPVGCLEAVRVLGSFEGMQKVIITPGLIELGNREYECNYALGLEAAKVCDIIILVGKNRSKPLREAVLSTEFDAEKLFAVSSFKEAMEVYSRFISKDSVVLLENDLPDNYLN